MGWTSIKELQLIVALFFAHITIIIKGKKMQKMWLKYKSH